MICSLIKLSKRIPSFGESFYWLDTLWEGEDNMTRERIEYSSINIVKVLCAYLVVAIHIHPLEEWNKTISYIVTDAIPKIAVPFFFVVSGYFFTQSLFKGRKVTLKYLKRLLVTYSLWSFIYVTYELMVGLKKGTIDVIPLLIIKMGEYLTSGVWFHLWYFPALMICVFMSYFMQRRNCLKYFAIFSIILYGIGIMGTAYYKIGNEIPVLSQIYNFSKFTPVRRMILTGIPYFMLGYWIVQINERFDEIKSSTIRICFFVSLVGFAIEIFFVNKFKLYKDMNITIFLYPVVGTIMMICLRNPMIGLGEHRNSLKYISNFTYYSHPLFMELTSNYFEKIMKEPIPPTLEFLIVCSLTTIIAVLIGRTKNGWLCKVVE